MSNKIRTATISPDRLAIGIAAISLVTIIMLASYIFSFNAITEAAAWTGNPEWTHFLAAVFIDGAILTYTISYAIFKWRGERGRRTRAFLYLFTMISVAVNFAHASSFWGWKFDNHNAVYGVLIAVAAPIAALLSSEEVVRLAFARPKSEATAAPTAPVAEPVVEPAAEPVNLEPKSIDAQFNDITRPNRLYIPGQPERPDIVAAEVFGGNHGYTSN